MSFTKTGVVAHDTTMTVAEGVRQAAQSGTPTAATVKAADIAFHRAGLASAKMNGIQPGQFIVALQELGTGGS
jgi:hypothetical protein